MTHHIGNVFCNVYGVFQVAVCNLASIAVNMFVRPDQTYDFMRLKEVTKIVTRNLNKIIDVNYYPIPEVVLEVNVHIQENCLIHCQGHAIKINCKGFCILTVNFVRNRL
jgi:hypothetical protein